MDWSEFPKSTFYHQEPLKENDMECPCRKLPKEQWCDHSGKGGFMGHTCVKKNLPEQNPVGYCRSIITDKEIVKSIKLVKDKIEMRLRQKHRGSYISNHETFGILAEEFHKELLDALKANDNEEFFTELIDIAVGAILGMASMYANAKQALEDKNAKKTMQ